ncbi:hypothetical protein C8Q75DRAFT_777715 [Abortiporus biennis]|nr:hypothetical protein C8Q75DRAFT_777715 [Abortiporus biennis]
MRLSRDIPVEVCELILDYFHPIFFQERIALLRCCLTCRSWVPRVRRNLYQEVKFMTVVESKNVKAFLYSLKSNMHLRGLTLKIIFSSVGNAEKLIPVGAAHHTLLLRGQAVLPNLQEIVLDYIPPLNPSLACISRPFRNVSKLSIQYTSFATLLDLRRIINNFFPNLQQLILDNSRFTSQSLQVIPPSSKATGTSLTTLNLIINGDQFAPLRSWLPSTNTRTTLKILNLRIGGGYVDLFTVQPLLLDCGSNVRELRVRWSQDTDVSIH